jgi:sulfur carrier protein
MLVELNGRREELPDGATVADAARFLGIDGDARGVAVALDGEVVRRSDWESRKLADRQAIEIVRAVQGG